MSVLSMLTLCIACLVPAPYLKKASRGDEPLPAVRSPNAVFASSENAILSQLNLTKEQLAQLNANNLTAQKRYVEIREKFKRMVTCGPKCEPMTPLPTGTRAKPNAS